LEVAMRAVPLVAAGLALAAVPSFGQEAAAPETAAPPAAATVDGSILLELNKLVPVEDACHAYVIVNNQRPEALKELKLDVYLFDKRDIIINGIALQFSDVGTGRTRVVPFELPDLSCDDIGRVLLNKVLACTDGSGAPISGCADGLRLSSRAEAKFEY
jgi:hypothetical protein